LPIPIASWTYVLVDYPSPVRGLQGRGGGAEALAASSMRMASKRSVSAFARKVNFEMAASKCDVFLLSAKACRSSGESAASETPR
jgi:hypothetical protein